MFSALRRPLSYREVRIMYRCQASFEVGRMSLHHIGDLRDVLGELWRLRARRRWPAVDLRRHLQLGDVSQRLRLQRVQEHAAAALALQRGARAVRAVLVGGAALVLAGVLRLAVGDVEQDEAEVGDGLDAGRVAQGSAVVEPLDLHVRISDRLQLALEVGRVAVLQVIHALKGEGQIFFVLLEQGTSN